MALNLELSPAQVAAAKMAGIPADRPGLLGDYPRMMYRKGTPNANDSSHNLAADANGGLSVLPIQGHKDIVTRVVDTMDEELLAAEDGWHETIDKALAPVAKKAAA